ncbi:hypothetical protein [Streptomyces sp. NPDC056663]
MPGPGRHLSAVRRLLDTIISALEESAENQIVVGGHAEDVDAAS